LGFPPKDATCGEFETVNDWLAYLKSPAGGAAAGGAISRYVNEAELASGDIDVSEAVVEAARIFGPLLGVVVPASKPSTAEVDPDLLDETATVPAPDGQRIWLYSPGENAEYWDEFYQQGVAAIGWANLGDLSQYFLDQRTREQSKN
jgi:hypothetical protein